jgi:hypothetical protein
MENDDSANRNDLRVKVILKKQKAKNIQRGQHIYQLSSLKKIISEFHMNNFKFLVIKVDSAKFKKHFTVYLKIILEEKSSKVFDVFH